jgi:hypothetical protein
MKNDDPPWLGYAIGLVLGVLFWVGMAAAKYTLFG